MAEATVRFFIQRLESVLLRETETFAGLEDQMEMVKGAIKEIGCFYVDRGDDEGDAAFSRLETELKNLVDDLDDQCESLCIQMDQQQGSDRSGLTDCFRTELLKVESRIAKTTHKMRELKNSGTTAGGMGEKSDNKDQSDGVQTELDSIPSEAEKEENEGDQTSVGSSSFPFRLKYNSLPYYLKSCLMYCCIFPENYGIAKGRLIRLLVAEGLILEKAGQIGEDVAEENINDLVSQGMLLVDNASEINGTKLTVSSPYRVFLRESYITAHPDSDFSIQRRTRRILTPDLTKVAEILNNTKPRSLFLFGEQDLSDENWLNFKGAKFLRVLDLEDAKIRKLPDEVGDLIHLAYLGLKNNDIDELPDGIGNLRALQSLDIRWCGDLTELSTEILKLVRLRHLKIYTMGIGKLGSLLTLTGVHAGGEIAGELRKLTQLRRLGVMDVAEENADELYASIMVMQGLLSLSLEAKHTFDQGQLVLRDLFSPPPVLRKLRLEGLLEKIPNWIGSMENLTNLRLGSSHLSENPTSVLQVLPNLEKLNLWHAYDGRQYGKDFCKAGGFPKLEVPLMPLVFSEEWTELEEGALPRLKYLHFHSCSSLRMLPEGLQFVTTVEELVLLPLLDEHEERLKPDGGVENYKIRNIPKITFIPESVVASRFNENSSTPPAPATDEE
uniref:Rx N-terminal domain-containing protein n=1 Tax=Salix viminalis TaxID=40686 RepID=A0A6N2LAN7_SALVM